MFHDVFCIFQRTERGPKDRNIAETDCKKFAEMLIEKLLRVQKEREKEREKEERIQMSLKAMNRVSWLKKNLIGFYIKKCLKLPHLSN